MHYYRNEHLILNRSNLCEGSVVTQLILISVWPFIFLLIMLVVSLFLAVFELAWDVWGPGAAPTAPEAKGAAFSRRLTDALCGCCGGKKKPPPQSRTASKPQQTTGHVVVSTLT